MKKVLLVAAIACVSLTSCKKDYTCECNVTTKQDVLGQVTTTPSTTSGTTGKMKKDEAKTKCEQSNGTTSSGIPGVAGSTITIACAIK
jgi:hypothetical protein